mmetsp:Transcript_5755/g.16485  ORF Transcript_5755/g.16485 Transcript_5755/m.16485 type:complete len:201 (+) Transcript_5755:2643-3245(+)
MNSKSDIKFEIRWFFNKIKVEHIDKLPHIFGTLYEDLGLQVYNVDEEICIPNVLCINAPVLNCLATYKTAIHIFNYLKASGIKDIYVSPDITTVSAMIIMLASTNYSFNNITVPFITNDKIYKMWADIGQLAKSDHVGSVLLAVAARGRSYKGFCFRQGTRVPRNPPDLLPVPSYSRNANNANVITLNHETKQETSTNQQ